MLLLWPSKAIACDSSFDVSELACPAISLHYSWSDRLILSMERTQSRFNRCLLQDMNEFGGWQIGVVP